MIVEHLIVETFGAHIGKYSERLKVTRAGDTLMQAPLLHLRAVHIIGRGISMSSDALEACCASGIPVFYLDSLGRSYASVHASGLAATVLTRREQLLAYHDERAALFALEVVAAKIHNQAATLKYLAKNRKETAPEVYDELRLCATEVLECQEKLRGLNMLGIDDIRAAIMGVEGHASARYWEAVRLVIPAQYGWTARETRGATDPVNTLLNYGYGILYGQIEQALILAGLDPYGGFLHADRPGKPALVLDLIEEFRQIAVDRVVFGLVNREFRVECDQAGRLTEATRRSLAEKVLSHLEAQVRYTGKHYPLRAVIQSQARALAAFLRRDRDVYAAFRGSW